MYTNFKTYVLSTVGDAPLCPENWCVARLLSTDRPKRGRKKLWATHMQEASLPVETMEATTLKLPTSDVDGREANLLRRRILVHGGSWPWLAVCFRLSPPLHSLVCLSLSAPLPQSPGPLSTPTSPVSSSVSCVCLNLSPSRGISPRQACHPPPVQDPGGGGGAWRGAGLCAAPPELQRRAWRSTRRPTGRS